MKPIVTWIVAADSGRVRVFENRGPGKGLVPVKGMTLEDPHQYARDTESDRLGRSYASVGHGRSAIEPRTPPAEHEEQAFAKRLADLLEAKWTEGAFNRLIIAAEPTALGNIRGALCEAVDKAVTAELHKDLTKLPLADLPRHFEGILAL
ncbi:MAG: host attachment protein [Devosia sp.]|nr:host attachment protein [Devosia sp.]